MCGRLALRAPRRVVPGCRLLGALRLGADWRSRVLGAPVCRAPLAHTAPVDTLPREPAVAVAHCVPPLHALPCGRPVGGEGGVVCLGSWGWWPLREHLGSLAGALLPCSPSGARPTGSGSSPWPSPTVPSATRVAAVAQCGAGGRGEGRAAWRAQRCGVLHPPSAAGGAGRSWAPGAAAWVSGQRVRRELHCCPRPHVARPGACAPRGISTRLQAAVVPPQLQGSRLPPTCPGAREWGGVPRLRGPWPDLGEQPRTLVCTLPPFCVRHQGPGARPTGRRARLPASGCQPARPLASSPVGSAVTCASACVGAGAAAVAGSLGGSASG